MPETKQCCDGIIAMHMSVKIDAAQFANWEPSRITAFFDGIAKALAAVHQPDSPSPETSP